ncbi:unnamed protein product [Cercospora beticola]|nr:unnamed protein product [Cercospora beticola]
MKAWLFETSSSAPVVEKNLYLPKSGIPRPKPSANEVLAEVWSTTLNPIDFKILELGIPSRLLFRSPVTPGLDLCGRVVEVGSKATSFKLGDIVYGVCNGVFGHGHGALAEYVPVSQDTIALVPVDMKAEDLGTIATVGLTTYQAMEPFVKPGDRVFINGGSGGTGVLAIQIAKALSCHVMKSCSASNVKLCKDLGADEVLDYKEADIVQQLKSADKPFDMILDNVGVPTNLYRISHEFLTSKGTYVQVGNGMDFSAFRVLLGNMFLPSFLGGGKRKYVFAVTKPNREDLQQLATWVQEGKIRVIVDSVYDFGSAREAFAKLKTGRARGKVVVRVKEARRMGETILMALENADSERLAFGAKGRQTNYWRQIHANIELISPLVRLYYNFHSWGSGLRGHSRQKTTTHREHETNRMRLVRLTTAPAP